MITTLAIANYRSLRDLVMPLGRLNVITGANASGKSNLYRALRLLGDTGFGSATRSLAREGGLNSVLWAGPEQHSRGMKSGTALVEGTRRRSPVNLKLGFAADAFSYSIEFGLPTPANSAFASDPEIKRESIWHGPYWRPASAVIERTGPLLKTRAKRDWQVISQHLPSYDSMLIQYADPARAPEIVQLRDQIRNWRFYDHFRVDADAPARQVQVGTRTPVLSADGHDLAAALQTILELGDAEQLHGAVNDAFAGASLHVSINSGLFGVCLQQEGLLRSLDQGEMSDGTLRYLLWVAALLTPRPPALMVLNEPETSLHPDLMPALARLIDTASTRSQVWVVSHSARLVAALEQCADCNTISLDKHLGETQICDQGLLDAPAWHWPPR